MLHGLRREPYFLQPGVHSRSATAPNYMILGFFGALVIKKDHCKIIGVKTPSGW